MKNKKPNFDIGLAKARVKVLEASKVKFAVSLDSSLVVESLTPQALSRELKVLRRFISIEAKKEI
jgi:hypothetical protein